MILSLGGPSLVRPVLQIRTVVLGVVGAIGTLVAEVTTMDVRVPACVSGARPCVAAAGAVVLVASSMCSAQRELRVPVSSYDDLFGDAQARDFSPELGGSSTVDFGGAIQFRYLAVYRGDRNIDDDISSGFQTARTLAWVGGEIGDFQYFVRGAFGRTDGASLLEDAWVRMPIREGVTVGAGQRKAPFMQEDLVGELHQQTVETSSAHLFASPGYVQGAWVYAEQESTRGWLMVHDGVGSANTDIDSTREADFAITGRGEYKWAGAWSQFDQFTSPMDAETGAKVGVAAHFQTGGSTVGSMDIDALYFLIDSMYQGPGWNLFGQVMVSSIDQTNAPDVIDATLIVQGGMYISQSTELFARFDGIFPDNARDNDPTSIITFGFNEYFYPDNPQALKFSFDMQWVLQDQQGSGTPTSSLTGVFSSNDAGQLVLKGQLQAKY